MSDPASFSRFRLGRLIKLGMGNHPWLEVEQAAAELSLDERRATSRALRRGQPAVDAPTARYAVALTPLYSAAGDWYARPGIRIAYGVIAAVQLLNTVLHAADGSWPSAAIFAVCAALFGYIAARPQAQGHAREPLAENLRLAGMPGDEAPALTPAPVTAAERVAGIAVAFVGFGLLATAGVAVGAAGDLSVLTVVAVGAGTSAGLLVLIWVFARATRRAWMTPGAVRAEPHPSA